MSGEPTGGTQRDSLKAVTYDEAISELTGQALVEQESARFHGVKANDGQPVPWRRGQQPLGNELWDLACVMINLPRARRQEQVEQGRRIGLARRMARMPLGTEQVTLPGKKKPRNFGDSTQAAHEAGIAQAPAEALEKYSNRYSVSIEWLVTGDYLGYQGNIAESSIFTRLALGHQGIFFVQGCFPDRRRWRFAREDILRTGHRLVSPHWLDPWLVCAIFLGAMHKMDNDLEYQKAHHIEDISKTLKDIYREMRYLRPIDPLDQSVVPDAE